MDSDSPRSGLILTQIQHRVDPDSPRSGLIFTPEWTQIQHRVDSRRADAQIISLRTNGGYTKRHHLMWGRLAGAKGFFLYISCEITAPPTVFLLWDA